MTKPIKLVKICYKLLYVIQGVKNIFASIANVLARIFDISLVSDDIKYFGHTYLFVMLFLIGLTLFYT